MHSPSNLPFALLCGLAVGCAPAAVEGPADDPDTASQTVDTDTVDTAVSAPDCSVLPPLPVSYEVYEGIYTAEDFDIDGEGYLVTVNRGNLLGTDMNRSEKLIFPAVTNNGSAGTRVLPNGDWVVADLELDSVNLVELDTGVKRILLGGLAYPNGVEVDSDGYVYVAEHNGGRLRWVHSETGDAGTVADGLESPNGVILSPDEQTLYAGSMGGGVIYAVDRLAPGTQQWSEWRILYDTEGINGGGFDGINVDICGNVYITEFSSGRINRITPDGLDYSLVIKLPSGWIPNMRWGHGIGGWKTDVMYVTGFTKIFALDMGIEGKKHVLVP